MTSQPARREVLVGAASIALGALLSGCGFRSDSGASASDRSVTVLLDWFPNPDHIALYLAQNKGYFAAAGLDVTLQSPSDPADPPKLVSTGKVDLGISYEPEMFLSRQAGLNVTAVAALIPTALNSVLATKNSPVKSLPGLAGHTIGDAGLASDKAFLQTIFARFGVDPGTVTTVDLRTSLITAMVSGNVDATIGGFRNIEAVQLQLMGADPLVVPVTDAGIPNYDELVVIAGSDRLASDPGYRQTVREFLSALAKGAQAAIDSPADAEASMAAVAKGYDAATLSKMVQATVPLLKGTGPLLSMDSRQWEAFGRWMLQNKLISAPIAASEVMSTRYLPGS